MATRTLKQVHHKPRPTQCQECGRMLPKHAYRDVCATCRKPAHKRVHIRDIHNRTWEEERRRAFAVLEHIDPDATPLTKQLRSKGYISIADSIRLARYKESQQQGA